MFLRIRRKLDSKVPRWSKIVTNQVLTLGHHLGVAFPLWYACVCECVVVTV